MGPAWMHWCTGKGLRVCADKGDSARGFTFPCMRKLIALLLFLQAAAFTQDYGQGILKRVLAKQGFSGELKGRGQA